MAKKLKVLFLPYLTDNPYQSLLIQGLSEAGVEIQHGLWFSRYATSKAAISVWKPDILHLHWKHFFLLGKTLKESLFKATTFIGELIVLKYLGVKIVWTAHNLLNHPRRYVALDKFFSRLMVRLADKIIVHCETAKTEVAKFFGINRNKITVIPHGNYISYYQNTIDRQQARNKLGVSADDIVYLYFGLIRPYKGVFELIDAFNSIEAPNGKLILAGKPHRNITVDDLEASIQANPNIITRFEYVPDDDIQIYFNAADVVVLPFKDLLTSGSIILAMSFGKAIIAPKIGCIQDALDEEGGILYCSSKTNGLTRALENALNADLAKMGKHNFACATQWQWSDIGQRTYDLYLDCI